jgi:hypothetical protein
MEGHVSWRQVVGVHFQQGLGSWLARAARNASCRFFFFVPVTRFSNTIWRRAPIRRINEFRNFRPKKKPRGVRPRVDLTDLLARAIFVLTDTGSNSNDDMSRRQVVESNTFNGLGSFG